MISTKFLMIVSFINGILGPMLGNQNDNCTIRGQHLRIHEIETQRALVAYEGGFSIPLFDEKVTCVSDQMAEVKMQKVCQKYENINGFSGSCDYSNRTEYKFTLSVNGVAIFESKLVERETSLISLVTGVLPNEQIEPVKVRLKENQLLVEEKVVILGN